MLKYDTFIMTFTDKRKWLTYYEIYIKEDRPYKEALFDGGIVPTGLKLTFTDGCTQRPKVGTQRFYLGKGMHI